MAEVLSCLTMIGRIIISNDNNKDFIHSAKVVASHNTIHYDRVIIFNLKERIYTIPVPTLTIIQPCPLPS